MHSNALALPPLFFAVRNVAFLAVYSCWLLILISGQQFLEPLAARYRFPSRGIKTVLPALRITAAFFVLGGVWFFATHACGN